ncbi:LPS export ABC transporter ATP-binding protein [bacterium]|jgi:lipopolysaccharide export system ATP-binding protein|nr:LPS export ABC transporter ATP-binding protein [bacterium]
MQSTKTNPNPPPAESTTRSLRARELFKTYSKRPIVKGVSIEVRSGQVVGLLGLNGAGKTTTFYMITGLIPPDRGTVLLDDTDITEWKMHQRAKGGIAYLPQEPSVFRKLTVEENILTTLESLPLTEGERKKRLQGLLDEFNLNAVSKQEAYTLSGGERRRVEVARALALSPAFILLDEPFAGVDPLAVADIQKMITSLKEKNIGVLITDHNVRETLSICDWGCILSEGVIFEQGTPEQIASSKAAREKYLGENFRF